MPIPEVTLIHGDALEVMRTLETGSFACILTSPPYNTWLTSPLRGGEGSEWRATYPEDVEDDLPYDDYIQYHRECLYEMLRLLQPDGLLWYVHQRKNLGIISEDDMPFDAFPLVNELLYKMPVRAEIVWDKKTGYTWAHAGNAVGAGYYYPNITTETIFVLAKSRQSLIRREVALKGQVWSIGREKGYKGHPAAFSMPLADRCIEGTLAEGRVLDPFAGSGTTALAAWNAGRDCVLIEKSREYIDLIKERLA